MLQDSVGNDLARLSREADTLRSATTLAASPAPASASCSQVLPGSIAVIGTGNANPNQSSGNGAANRLVGGLGKGNNLFDFSASGEGAISGTSGSTLF